MSVKFRSIRRLALLAVTAALLLTPISALAQGGTPSKDGSLRSWLAPLAAGAATQSALRAADVAPQDATFEVIAEGLNNPRGLDLTSKNQLYVAEAGVGGDDPNACLPNPEDPTEEVCAGNTGSVTRINLNSGAVSRVATGFPSLAGEDGSAATGLTDVSLKGGNFGIVGLGADPAMREVVGAGFGYAIKNPQSPKWRNSTDVAQHEADANPDGGEVDSNPYSIAALNGVESVVADAGANALLHVNAAKQQVHTVAVFPDRMVLAPPFLGLPPGAMMPMQSVPNAVVVGPDGAFYVGELTGFPFLAGGANVYRVEMDGSMSVYAGGFTNIIDIAFDADGNLYVLEITKNGLMSGDPTGALIKVDAITGDRTEIASDGLVLPGGVVVGPDGSIYVSNFSIFAGGGQVVKITP